MTRARTLCLILGVTSLAAGTGNANAQAPTKADVLIQACQSLKRQSDRNKCLEEAVKAAAGTAKADSAPVAAPPVPAPPSNKDVAAKRSEQVFAAAQALQSVIDIGVSYNDYQPYVQKLAVELGTYKNLIVLDEEKRAAEKLQLALVAYTDSSE